MNKLTLIALALFILIGRFTIENQPLHGWVGAYMALAHIFLGVLIGVAWMRGDMRKPLAWFVVLASTLELVLFLSGGVPFPTNLMFG
ncbi:MAG: hypothetical protein WB816_08905 [Methylocystis sp.]